MNSFTNRDLIDRAFELFDTTGAYTFPSQFANRESTISYIENALGNKAKFIIISDYLGSGKTFLIQSVWSKIALAENLNYELPLLDLTTDDLEDSLTDLLRKEPRIIVIDEIDSKRILSRVCSDLQAVLSITSDMSSVPIVLIGDKLLHHVNIKNLLGNISEEHYVPMQPLDKGFLLLAVLKRMKSIFGNKIKCFTDEQLYHMLFEPKFLSCLVPNSTSTAAIFRSTFKLLSEMADKLEPEREEYIFSMKEYMKVWNVDSVYQRLNDNRKVNFLKRFFRHIKDITSTTHWIATPFSIDDLLQISDDTQEDFENEVVHALCKCGLIQPLGIPFEMNSSFGGRLNGPYMPTPTSFLGASLQ